MNPNAVATGIHRLVPGEYYEAKNVVLKSEEVNLNCVVSPNSVVSASQAKCPFILLNKKYFTNHSSLTSALQEFFVYLNKKCFA